MKIIKLGNGREIRLYSYEDAVKNKEPVGRYLIDLKRRFLDPALELFGLLEEPAEDKRRRDELVLIIISWSISIGFAVWLLGHIKIK
jgi:hypothetical protein